MRSFRHRTRREKKKGWSLGDTNDVLVLVGCFARLAVQTVTMVANTTARVMLLFL